MTTPRMILSILSIIILILGLIFTPGATLPIIICILLIISVSYCILAILENRWFWWR